jgi:hypothetical protein
LAAKLFTDVLAKGIRQGQVPARTEKARDWYRKQAKLAARGSFGADDGDPIAITGRNMIKELKTDKRARQRQVIGSMYLFQYDPKHKDTLPYYDKFPLVFPINKAKGGFLGLNMHYLPPQLRAQMMDALYTVTTNEKYDDSTRLKISYDILNSASKFKFFAPCVKHYLAPQVKTSFMKVAPTEWDIALFLPLQQFIGAGKQKVWADSRKIIRGR